MTFTSRLSLGSALSCALLALAAPSLARAPSPLATPPAQAPSDSELRRFARAAVAVVAIQQEMAPRIQAAPAHERAALAQSANERMAAAVRQHDLDAQAFNRISAAIEQDPDLAQQVQVFVQEEAAAR